MDDSPEFHSPENLQSQAKPVILEESLKSQPVLSVIYPTRLTPLNQPNLWWKKLPIVIGVASILLLIPIFINIIKDVVAPVPPVLSKSSVLENSSNNLLETKSIAIGSLGDSGNYKGLADYLHKALGTQVKITIDSDKNISYQQAKNHLANKQWDIAFTLSPVLSVAAKDNNYTWAAKMFPNKPSFYQSALFVRSDSPIHSLGDIKSTTVIALGDFNSASSFYIPSYGLFGKSLTVNMGHRGHDILEMVKTGKADIGAAAFGDTVTKDPNFRIIQLSRNIPGSGVYLSSKLSANDQKIIAKVILDAPEEVKRKANYGQGQEVDYSVFLGIVRRVEKVLACSDFSKNPVNFYCSEQKGIVGQVNGITQIDEQITRLTLRGKDGHLYYVLVSSKLLNQIPGAGSAIALQNKTIRLLDSAPEKLADGNLQITVAQPDKMEVLDN